MKLKITVHGVAYDVDVEIMDPEEGFAPSNPLPVLHHGVGAPSPPYPIPGAAQAPVATGNAGASNKTAANSVTSPIAGTILEVHCKTGETVSEGQNLLTGEAMKMKTSIAAPGTGKIKAIPVSAGDTVREGQVLVEFE